MPDLFFISSLLFGLDPIEGFYFRLCGSAMDNWTYHHLE